MDVDQAVAEDTILTKFSLKQIDFQKMGIFFALIALCLLFTILSEGRFLTMKNFMTVARQASMAIIVGVGMTFLMITANIDLAVGSYLALTGVFAAYTLQLGVPWWGALLLTMVALGVLQIFVGLTVAKLKIQSLIITLAMMSIAKGLALSWSGGSPVYIENETFIKLGTGYIGPIPVPIVLAVLVTIIGQFVLSRTRFGRYVYALGGNEEAAVTSGINVDRIKVAVFMIAGLLTGLAGCIMAGRLFSGSPIAGRGFELTVIAGVVIGGTRLTGGAGNMIGTLLGMLTVGVIGNGLTILGVEYYYQQIAQGVIIFLAVFIDSRTKLLKS